MERSIRLRVAWVVLTSVLVLGLAINSAVHQDDLDSFGIVVKKGQRQSLSYWWIVLENGKRIELHHDGWDSVQVGDYWE